MHHVLPHAIIIFAPELDIFSTKNILKFLGMGGVLLAAIAAPNAVSAFSFLLKEWKSEMELNLFPIKNKNSFKIEKV